VYSKNTSIRLKKLDTDAGIKVWEGVFLGGNYSVGVVAIGKTGKGYIILIPRYLFGLSGYTARFTDKPALSYYLIQNNKIFEDNLVEYFTALLKGKDVFRPFNPVIRTDKIKNFIEKPENVTLEKGSIYDEAPENVYEELNFYSEKKRNLNKVLERYIFTTGN